MRVSAPSAPPSTRIRFPIRTALAMVAAYVRGKVGAQVRAVAFIILYLAGFHWIVLGTPPAHAARLAFGIGLTVLGLAAFLEGLYLGLMPLGERIGVRLPQRTGLGVILAFGFLLGMGATLAEPSLFALRAAGVVATPWATPLLYRLLEREPGRLMLAIGAGVGVAVACGMLRFARGISIKPFVFLLVPALLAATLIGARDPHLRAILGLAWDAGAITTGPVTVPLVLALGIGTSRAIGKCEGATSGFGIVMLASAFPVLGVLALGALLRASTPPPVSAEAFFAPRNHAVAVQLVGSADALREWRERATTAAPGEMRTPARPSPKPTSEGVFKVLRGGATSALRAVLPLTLLLAALLPLLGRERFRHGDEIVFGILLAWLGMTLLTSGIRLGLAPLGDAVGRPLPRVFRSVAREEGRLVLEAFRAEDVFTVYAADGTAQRSFHLRDARGRLQTEPFHPEMHDTATGRYLHIVRRPPLFGPSLTLAGIALVLLFAFGMGFGSTLAEPALRALGHTVEELSAGAMRGSGLVQSVSLGVGAGLLVGMAGILYGIPMHWLLLPPYLALLPLTYWSDEDFAAIAWDCGGVTTGPVTVPLVLAMGLSVGGELGAADGFGVLAMASAYPIVAVLVHGLAVRVRQRRAIRGVREEGRDE